MEFLSSSTEAKDRGKKFIIYRDILKVRDYFLCDNRGYRLEGFRLDEGVYVPISPTPEGRLHSGVLDLYLGWHDRWLRWFTPGGDLLLSGRELAEDEARRRREVEERVARLEEELRRLRGEGGHGEDPCS